MQNKLKPINSEEITPQAALMFVDNALYQTEGRRLNDLESRIFLGSWEGKTYEEIHPLNPEYVEKSVGYKLWKKLSIALGEKVSKKRIRGAVMRHYCRVDYSSVAPDRAEGAKCATIWHQATFRDPLLMPTLKNCLKDLGYQVESSASADSPAQASPPLPPRSTWAGPNQDVLVITVSQGGVAPDAIAPDC